MDRCPECGSWEAECDSDQPVEDCGCARCLSQTVSTLRTELAELKKSKDTPVAWCREWDGDVSDIGNMIVVFDESECDHGYDWYPLYLHPQPTKKQQQITTDLLNKLALTPVDAWRFNGVESMIILGALYAYNTP